MLIAGRYSFDMQSCPDVGRLDEGLPGSYGRPVRKYTDVVECLRVLEHVGCFLGPATASFNVGEP
jgi:hypothetical protein